MKRLQWALPILLVAVVQVAHAGTFDLTTIKMTVFFGGGDNVEFALTGPGTDITGFGGIACQPTDWCTNPVFPPGSVLPNIGQISIANFNSAILGGTTYDPESEFGFTSGFSVDVLGSFILPVNPHGSTFTACVPATMSGPINGNAGTGPTFTQFTLLPPTGGSLCTKWDFGGGVYQFAGGTFFVSTVPEPGTLGLMASGLIGIFSLLRKKYTTASTV